MISWIKRNKLATVLLVIVLFFVYIFFQDYFGIGTLSLERSISNKSSYAESGFVGITSSDSESLALPEAYSPEYTPQTDTESRLVVQTSNMSLLVESVVETRNKILEYANTNGGYMVSAQTQNPEDTPTATVIIRIPASGLQKTLDYFHSLSIKVVSENLVGKDVTDQYVDIDTKISQLEKTKTRLELILDSATEIKDITNLTTQILSYQNQIDSLKGQQDALEKNAQLAKLTVYLSTDEVALPYTPSETFRPRVIFKLAVRSLVRTLRGIGKLAIWLVVYSTVWVPALLIYIFVKKWWKNRKKI